METKHKSRTDGIVFLKMRLVTEDEDELYVDEITLNIRDVYSSFSAGFHNIHKTKTFEIAECETVK